MTAGLESREAIDMYCQAGLTEGGEDASSYPEISHLPGFQAEDVAANRTGRLTAVQMRSVVWKAARQGAFVGLKLSVLGFGLANGPDLMFVGICGLAVVFGLRDLVLTIRDLLKPR
jgi:hypothetical protein